MLVSLTKTATVAAFAISLALAGAVVTPADAGHAQWRRRPRGRLPWRRPRRRLPRRRRALSRRRHGGGYGYGGGYGAAYAGGYGGGYGGDYYGGGYGGCAAFPISIVIGC